MALLLREKARADGHGHRQHRRHRDGNRRHGEDERRTGVMSRNGSPRTIETTMITLTMAMARMIRYVPILSTARWK